MPDTKHCNKCDRDLPIAEFPMTTAYGKRVLRSWCKACMKDYYRSRNVGRRKGQAPRRNGQAETRIEPQPVVEQMVTPKPFTPEDQRISRPRNAIERMIDEACGITEDAYA